jgi:hypothetical protein
MRLELLLEKTYNLSTCDDVFSEKHIADNLSTFE